MITSGGVEAGGRQRVRFDMPGLIERPAVGTTCCVSSADAIVVQELSMLPGIDDVVVDLAAGAIEVTFAPGSVTREEMATALAEIGYPVVEAGGEAEAGGQGQAHVAGAA